MTVKPALLGGDPLFKKPIPFAKPTLPAYDEIEKGFREIIESGMVTKGKYLKQYEERLKSVLEVPYALGVVNCTIGLYMLIKALKLTGEIIVPSFSFMATFHVAEMAGLTPVFVDCERDTFTIDPKKVEEAITPNTSGIIGVSVFGNPPDMNALEKIAEKHHIKFIMDSAHSLGTLYYGRPMGGRGDGEVFSTSATKLIATGEGGIITTRSKETADFIESFREYGNKGDYDCETAGINGRLSEFHSYLGLMGIDKLEEYAEHRNHITKFYRESLMSIPGITFQKIRDGCRSSYKDFALLIDPIQFGLDRDQLSEALMREGIPTKRYFYPPGHMQKVYQKYRDRYGETLSNTEFISKNIIILPLYSHMKTEITDKIVEAVNKTYGFASEIREYMEQSYKEKQEIMP